MSDRCLLICLLQARGDFIWSLCSTSITVMVTEVHKPVHNNKDGTLQWISDLSFMQNYSYSSVGKQSLTNSFRFMNEYFSFSLWDIFIYRRKTLRHRVCRYNPRRKCLQENFLVDNTWHFHNSKHSLWHDKSNTRLAQETNRLKCDIPSA